MSSFARNTESQSGRTTLPNSSSSWTRVRATGGRICAIALGLSRGFVPVESNILRGARGTSSTVFRIAFTDGVLGTPSSRQ